MILISILKMIGKLKTELIVSEYIYIYLQYRKNSSSHILGFCNAGVGQTQDVTVIKLIADKSIEEHILSMAEIKLRLDRSVSGLKEGQEESEDDEEQKEKVQSLLKTVLLS